MKIVYAYGKMFTLHPSGFVSVYERDDVVAQRIVEQEIKERADSRIIDLEHRLDEIDKSVSVEGTKTEHKGLFARIIGRFRNETG